MSNIEYSGLDEVQLAILNNARATHVDEDVVVDSDTYLVIDVKTKTIINKSGKNDLVQFDHNSERLTFEVDRYIDGHDVLLCNSIRVEYVGVDNEGIYAVTDVRVNPDDKSKVIFTWLITSNVTQNIGNIKFVVIFECLQEDSTVNYSWSTKVHETLTVVKGIRNESTIMIKSIDILDQWRNEILTDFVEATLEARDEAIQASNVAKQEAYMSRVNSMTTTADRAYVESVVAGNEAYTKYESDVKYAPVIVESVNGTDILIQDGSNRPVESIEVLGNSTQDGEPTPDNPIEFSSIGDKGYFDGELLQGAYGAVNGAFGNNTYFVCSKNPIPCNGGDTVKLIYGSIARTLSLVWYDENMAFIAYKNVSNSNENEVVVPTNARYIHFSVNNSENAMTVADAKHICVTINGMYALIVKNVNKNSLENSATSLTRNGGTFTVNADKSVTVKGTFTAPTAFTIGTLNCFANTSYKINKQSNQYYFGVDGTTNYISSESIPKFTPTVDREVTVVLYFNGNVTVDETFYPMVTKAEITDDTYVPHQEQTTYIPLTEPLRGIGEVKDEIACVNGVYGVIKKINKYVCDGSSDENWTDSGSTAYPNSYLYTGLFNLLVAKKGVYDCMCNYFAHTPVASTPVDTDTPHIRMADVASNPYIALWVSRDMFASVSDFTAWLAENPMTIIYARANETFTPLVDQRPFTELRTFKPVTHITTSDGAEMTVNYIADTKLYIDKKLKELVNE